MRARTRHILPTSAPFTPHPATAPPERPHFAASATDSCFTFSDLRCGRGGTA